MTSSRHRIHPQLARKAIEGAAALAAESCATRHGESECACRPSSRVVIDCEGGCNGFTEHDLAFEQADAADPLDPDARRFDQIYRCRTCGVHRRFGRTFKPVLWRPSAPAAR